ncbi:MAG: efflux RND transporter periplasmic adaptor subunit [Myxococcota bacterium]
MNSHAPDSELAKILELGTAPRRRGLKVLWVGLVAILVLGGALVAWRMSLRETSYETLLVKRDLLIATVSATGTIEPTDQVEIGSEISGIVEAVYVDFNERVEAEQVIAKLDTEVLLAQVRSSRASLNAAAATLKEADVNAQERQSDFARQSVLFERQMVSQQVIDAARFALLRAEAAVESARARVEVSRAALLADSDRLAKAEIRSPIAGVVISRAVEPGQTVAASFQTPVLFVVAADLTEMELHLDVDEADVGRIAAGQAATFTVDAFPSRTFPARIESVRLTPKSIHGVVTYEALLSVENTEGVLRPGMTATAEIETGRRAEALQIPNAALRFAPEDIEDEGEGERVWVLGPDNTPERVPVTLGLTDDSWTEVVTGDLAPDAAVIVDIQEEPK